MVLVLLSTNEAVGALVPLSPTEHLYPYRMKCGLGGSVAQNTIAISLVVSFSLIFPLLVNHVVLVWRMNANRLIWPYQCVLYFCNLYLL